ncbi:polysaccharide biosynthesis protein [Calidithermus roseus]|uniref:UDP-N-acetyl-alpha-D-glucosamine C6 dehydratase n=1 Tax=Calidithermus roseus TaxID=1644118 RepID=A0A399EPK9_9DEIN|nr:nucleoside-diphosphate sugar epimerase/dehydratase [Calidithermus roseus]RIH84452.1 UDP-N-acetyl-alpha-D-glucosamine C6 dehydratase [Calidithermus roseus]
MSRIPLKFAIDLLLWASAAPIAFWLRLDNPWPQYSHMVLLYTALGFPLKALLIYGFGLHRQSWHKVGVRDLEALAKAIGLGVIVLAAVAFLSPPELRVPRSVPLIAGGIAFLLMGGARLLDRLLHERVRGAAPGEARRILVVGAGEAGTMIVREMLRHPEAKLLPVGFLDDEPSKRRQKFLGLPVLGSLDDLPQAVEATEADEVLIAIPSAPGRVVRRVVELARQAKLSYRIIPGVYEILSGRVSISQIREVDLEDLLRREPVRLDLAEIAGYLENRVVLVTGAGGSIGSEIVRQVARFRPQQVILLGRGENSLYQIERELERTWPELDYCTVIADVRQREKMERVFEIYQPQVVFHAAAHKHVPLMERNPDEAIFNNVGGTRNLVELSLKHGVDRFVNISTDKAVNPTSVMGASKRVAEYLVEGAARKAGPGQVFVSVRFGNVLGSRGSVIPLFREQIRMGGPVTVTHPEMTRYFMTIPEAAQLVLQAGGLGQNGAVYVLDMGEPVRILDLAHDLIRLSGLEPGVDIELVFTGTRPGEKLFEELLTAEEGTEASKHEKIYVARKTGLPESQLANLLERLFAAAKLGDEQQIRLALKSLIPTYVTTATPADGG